MAKTMTASATITDGQIDNVANKLRDALRKHRAEFGLEATQNVLGLDNLGMELLAPFRRRVEAVSNLIVRRVKVDRTRTPEAVLAATGRRQYVDNDVVAAMPRGKGGEVELGFFKPRPEAYDRNGFISDERLALEFEYFGLEPDPLALAQFNADNPAFADSYPNATHWQDANGRWCYASFDRWSGERDVDVYRFDRDWLGFWRFAGRRK